MNWLKRIGLSASNYVLRTLVFVTITVTAAVIVFSNSGNVKNALVQTKAYDRLVPSVIEANIKTEQARDSIPFNDKAVQQIIISSFPSDSLQDKGENLIDSFYKWLRGETARPDFRVDFTANKLQMADGLSAFAFRQLQGLPVCDYQPEEIDPFYAACRPANMDYAAEQANLSQQIFTSDSFLKDTVLTAGDLAKDQNGKTILDRLSYIPQVYQWLMRAPWILISLTALSGLAYILLCRRPREGVYAVGFALVGSAISLILLTIVFGFVIPHYTQNFNMGMGGGGTQTIMDDALNTVTKDFDTMAMNISLQVAGLGLLIIFFERLTRSSSRYYNILPKTGIMTSVMPRNRAGKILWRLNRVPIISSDETNGPISDPKDLKYRKIPKGDM